MSEHWLASLRRPALSKRSSETMATIARANSDPRSFTMRDRVAAAVFYAHYGEMFKPRASLGLMFWAKNERVEYERARSDRLLLALDELGIDVHDRWSDPSP